MHGRARHGWPGEDGQPSSSRILTTPRRGPRYPGYGFTERLRMQGLPPLPRGVRRCAPDSNCLGVKDDLQRTDRLPLSKTSP